MPTKTNHLSTVALLLCLLANGALCLELLAGAGVTGSVTGSLTLKANTETTINFVGGTKLVITGTADATVSAPNAPFLLAPWLPLPCLLHLMCPKRVLFQNTMIPSHIPDHANPSPKHI